MGVRYDTEARRDVFFSEDALNEWRNEVRVVFNHRSHDTVEIAAGPDRGYASDRTMWEAAMSKETPKPPGRTPINAHSTHVDKPENHQTSTRREITAGTGGRKHRVRIEQGRVSNIGVREL